MKQSPFLLFLVLFFLAHSVLADVPKIPSNLSKRDREEVVRILGLGTSTKLLTDPYPLGGYSGFEISLGLESLGIDDLSRLGNRTPPQSTFTYPKLYLGKGLYNNVDTYIHFIPFNESTGLSEYGGFVRWSFYQAQFLPANFTIALHGNSSNLSNQFISRSYGADFVTSINVSQVALYFGGGKVSATGYFSGGSNTLTDSLNEEVATTEAFHTVIGTAFTLASALLSFQIDQYSQTVYSAKMGMRF